jgi:hypothetical protein
MAWATSLLFMGLLSATRIRNADGTYGAAESETFPNMGGDNIARFCIGLQKLSILTRRVAVLKSS